MRGLKRRLFDWVMQSHWYPHIFFLPNPFKPVEFWAVMSGVRLRPTDVALDLGCGGGLITSLIGRRAKRVVGIDISRSAIDRAFSEQPLVAGRIETEFRATTVSEAAFPDATFDAAFSFCVVEHIPAIAETLREVRRVLKPGAVFALSADSLGTIPEEDFRREHARAHRVVNYFDVDALRRRLQEAGFIDVRVRPILRSGFARWLFMRGARHQFQYRFLQSILLACALRIADAFGPADRGIFLVAHAKRGD